LKTGEKKGHFWRWGEGSIDFQSEVDESCTVADNKNPDMDVRKTLCNSRLRGCNSDISDPLINVSGIFGWSSVTK
jgi:hypothetical protein